MNKGFKFFFIFSGFSMYGNEELSNNIQSKMSLEESVQFLRKIVLKWNEISDEGREAYETMLKTMKKKQK